MAKKAAEQAPRKTFENANGVIVTVASTEAWKYTSQGWKEVAKPKKRAAKKKG